MADEAAARKIESSSPRAAWKRRRPPPEREVLTLNSLAREDLLPELTGPVFSLQQGAVSASVQSLLGWYVVRVSDIEGGKRTQAFEQVRDTVLADVKRDRAMDTVFDRPTRSRTRWPAAPASRTWRTLRPAADRGRRRSTPMAASRTAARGRAARSAAGRSNRFGLQQGAATP